MPLSNTLNTNEIKNAAGTEVEFSHLSNEGQTHTYKAVGEAPNLQHRFRVAHQEIGESVDRRRRSNVSFSKEVTGVSGTKRKIVIGLTGDLPIGDIANMNDVKDVLAELLSFCATTGAATTVLFDCSGNGASCIVNGDL